MATTVPVDVTYDNLLMYIETAQAVYLEELERPIDNSGLASSLLMALEGKTVDDLRAWVRASPEWHQKHDRVLPPPPSRAEVCGVMIGFQGVTVHTTEFGSFPAFGPETTSLDDDDLDAYVRQMADRGSTHVEIAVSWAYDEPGFHYPVPGRDLTGNLADLHRRLERMLTADPRVKAVLVFLAGDGRSAPKQPDGTYPYNDPQGHTYGYEWLMENFPRIGDALRDLAPYLLFVPGYDGVFYGWGNRPDEPAEPDLQPQRVLDFGALFRQVLPTGYLAIEHSTGKIPVGDGGAAFGAGLQAYDVVLSEFENWPTTGDATWQIGARLLGPAYVRPADEPASDDPRPPFYLAPGTPRGPYVAVAYEFATYPWVRGAISAADVDAGRAYYRALGYTFTG